MDDLISRQAAIKILHEALDAADQIADVPFGVYQNYRDKMNELPPAQLGTNLAEVGTDCISRAKAIDGKICIRRSNGVEIYDDYVVPVEYLEQLPPANCSEFPNNSDTISRQAAIDAINHELRCGAVIDQCGLETAHDLIEELPSAQPEIVRCKDCKY